MNAGLLTPLFSGMGTQTQTQTMMSFSTQFDMEIDSSLPMNEVEQKANQNHSNVYFTQTQESYVPQYKNTYSTQNFGTFNSYYPGSSHMTALIPTFEPQEIRIDAPQEISESQVELPLMSKEEAKKIVVEKRFDSSSHYTHGSAFYFQQKELRKRKQRLFQSKQRQQRRMKQVQMHRHYRQGELPDVQIKYGDIIEPFRALVLLDPILAGLSVVSLTSCISDPDDEILSKCLNQQLKNSFRDSALINTLLRICYENKHIILDPDLIASVSISSSNFHMGIMVLERQILTLQLNVKENSSYKHKIAENAASLAKLYKAIGEDDILLGLYEKHISKNQLTKKALEYEFVSDYSSAAKVYYTLLKSLEETEEKPDQKEIDVWENGLLECFENLIDWNALHQNVLAEIDSDLRVLWDEEHIDMYLRYFIYSSLKLKEHHGNLLEFVDSANPFQREYLEKMFLPELTFMSVLKNDIGKSSFYVAKTYQKFVEDWSTLPTLAKSARHQKLQELQKIREIEEYLSCIKLPFSQSERGINQLLKTWRNRLPSVKNDSVIIWDTVINQRSNMFSKLFSRYETHISSLEGEENKSEELKQKLKDEVLNLYLEIANSARKQHSFSVSQKFHQKYRKAKKKDKNFDFRCVHSMMKLHCLDASLQKPEVAIEKFIKAVNFIDTQLANVVDNEEQYTKLLKISASSYHSIYKFLPHYESKIREFGASTNRVFMEEDLNSALTAQTYQILEKAKKLETDETHSSIHYKLALYCDELLKEDKIKEDPTRMSKKIIELISESMRRGSLEARQRFPRLLQLLIQYPKNSAYFRKQVKTIPAWMFISWIPQVLGLMSTPVASSVMEIILRLMKDYPQSIYYPFVITSEGLDTDQMEKVPQILQYFEEKLPTLKLFVNALDKLTNPEHRWNWWYEELSTLLPIRENDPFDEEKVLKMWTEIYSDCFDRSQNFIGSENKRFAANWGKKVEMVFGKNGEKLITMTRSNFRGKAQELGNTMTKQSSIRSGKRKLTGFSTWLSHFDQLDKDNEIEIPGQYKGIDMPDPNSHTKISAFGSNVLVMSSLRKPKRLSIIGDDEKEHYFLVKGGEDLRLDQRVEQIFSVMNHILDTHPLTSTRNLKIHVYDVIPMTSKIGILEWVKNTEPLKSIIMDVMKKDIEDDVNISTIPATELHRKFLKEACGGKTFSNPATPYHYMFANTSRKKAVKKIEKQHASTSWDLLRRGIMRLSASPEAFLLLRNKFSRSLAAFSIGSYIIGIGDRHLENFLLDLTTGGIVGIDFGHAFGTGTQLLPVPELVPFRLTRQLRNVLLPLDSEGLLKHNMVQTLEALRQNKDIILNVMDIFIQEPLVDWQKNARKIAHAQGKENNDKEWYPEEKLKISKRKLELYNPARITLYELKKSVHSNKEYLPNVIDVVNGDPKDNIRARVGNVCESVSEQVDCLVDQATDPNILSRAWSGWSSFL
eukprot:TRINITY_DN3175_c0_g1_i1.p1 TRINITY_DN3175_c0_g1~~TRINITY_DN3175_c0_g1_i1.p1  ORF type:complete len:1540 (+),score=329.42 TRINITY_DN3175_c0_g1_i1:246-4622(+)